MKKYIFLTPNIHPIGGTQKYTAGKAKFLEAEGWQVAVFFSGRSNSGGCVVKSLEKYTAGWFPEISIPPGNWPAFIRNAVLKNMREQIGDVGEETVIESQASGYALWGELLAQILGAKHFCFICNETFRGKDRFYAEYLEYFDFKHKRRELAGIHPTSLPQLFDGYKQVAPKERYTFLAAIESVVQDVSNENVDAIQCADWNICYIGRINKGYVPGIIEGVRNFSLLHPDKSIQFIFVGGVKKQSGLIRESFSGIKNVELVFLGDCVPIPRSLFLKIDVVIAGSGSAICAAQENVLTILADAENFKANGVLGIDTANTLYCEDDKEQMSYEEALERVLVRKVYEGKQILIPAFPPCEYHYREHFKMIENSETDSRYYDVIRNKKFSHEPSWIYYRLEWMIKVIIRRYLSQKTPAERN